MSKTFEFDDGQPCNSYDTRSGRVTTWTREEFVYAVNAYSKTKGPRQAAAIIQQICGMADPTMVPSYSFGAIIGIMAQQLTGREERDHASNYRSNILGRVGRRTHPLLKLPAPKDDA